MIISKCNYYIQNKKNMKRVEEDKTQNEVFLLYFVFTYLFIYKQVYIISKNSD